MKSRENEVVRFLISFLNVAIIICAVPAFVQVNFVGSKKIDLDKVFILSFFLILVGLVFYLGSYLRRYWGPLSWFFTLILQMGLLFFLFPPEKGKDWFLTFLKELGFEVNNVWKLNFNVMPTLISTISIVFLTVLILGLSIYVSQWYLAFPISLLYILSVTVFDNQDHLIAAILTLFFFAVQIFLITNYDELFRGPKKKWGLLFFGLGILLLSISGGLLFRKTFVNVTKVIDGPGLKVRNKLNTLGFYQSINEQTKNNQDTKKAGFSLNSRDLGGPILDNNKLVCTVWESKPNYLRIDTKNSYSGQGFNDIETAGDPLNGRFLTLNELQLPFRETGSTIKIIYSKNFVNDDAFLVPQVYGKLAIDFTDKKITRITHNMENSLLRYESKNPGNRQINYKVDYYDLSRDQLKNIDSKIYPDIIKTYTQLPAKVPNRVKKLAKQITENSETQLDRVLAIEKFLKTDQRFTYSRLDASKTPEHHDFVDYFLFDHPVGYCDNFATSMVILLRTIGIPARYAEGFSPGSYKQKIGDMYEYEVRNNNAHSWPEVYFQNVGWVPFEPTPGFAEKHQNVNGNQQTKTTTVKQESTSQSSTSFKSSSAKSKSSSQKSKILKRNKPKRSSHQKPKKSNPLLPVVGSILGIVMLTFIFTFRHTIYWLILKFVFCKVNDPAKFYRKILKHFEGILKRNRNETLIQYAKRVGTLYPQISNSYLAASHCYEILIYGHRTDSNELRCHLNDIISTMIINPRDFHKK